MLYKESPDPPQVRTRCRNPRCAEKLKIPAANPRDAFCSARCEAAYFAVRCRVCTNLFTPKTKRRTVCSRDKCRYAFKSHPEQFRLRCERSSYPSQIAHNAKESSTKSKLKTGAESGRGWRVVAGPAADLHPLNLADLPANTAERQTGRRAGAGAVHPQRSTSSADTNSQARRASRRSLAPPIRCRTNEETSARIAPPVSVGRDPNHGLQPLPRHLEQRRHGNVSNSPSRKNFAIADARRRLKQKGSRP